MVFGRVFASHQICAAAAALAAGAVRDQTGSYALAWLSGAALCLLAAGLSVATRRPPVRGRPVIRWGRADSNP